MISVQVPDESAGRSLTRQLSEPFDVELVRGGGGWRVEVKLDRESNRLVTELLSAVEAWLGESRLDAATVRLDGHEYTLVRPG